MFCRTNNLGTEVCDSRGITRGVQFLAPYSGVLSGGDYIGGMFWAWALGLEV